MRVRARVPLAEPSDFSHALDPCTFIGYPRILTLDAPTTSPPPAPATSGGRLRPKGGLPGHATSIRGGLRLRLDARRRRRQREARSLSSARRRVRRHEGRPLGPPTARVPHRTA